MLDRVFFPVYIISVFCLCLVSRAFRFIFRRGGEEWKRLECIHIYVTVNYSRQGGHQRKDRQYR